MTPQQLMNAAYQVMPDDPWGLGTEAGRAAMTLRVPFWVNDEKIGEVEISRTFTDLTGPGIHRYVWYLRTWTDDGWPYTHSSIVDHSESDGALALIRMVLDACQYDQLHSPRQLTP